MTGDRSLSAPPPELGQPASQEARILRERILDLDAALDQKSRRNRTYASPRFVGQVYNGGNMPSTVPAIYLTHPVQLGGGEIEGGTASYSVDTSTSVPVVFLGHVPSVGDYETVWGASGRWVTGAGASSTTCNTTICVNCLGTAISGATVTITSGMTTIATGTTGSNGCVTLAIGSAGSYTVTIAASGYNTVSGTYTLTCGGTTAIGLCACGACFGATPPDTLTLTISGGAGGNIVVTLNRIPNEYTWEGTNETAVVIDATITCSSTGLALSLTETFNGECLGANYYPAVVTCNCLSCCVPSLISVSCNPIDIIWDGCGYFAGLTFTITA
jgi:Carboxypeptidase regulatory-like domain